MLRTIFRKNLTLRYQNKIFSGFAKMEKSPNDITDLSKMRVDFNPGFFLDEDKMEKKPIDEFKNWLKECIDSKKVGEPNAMVLCTASKDGIPNARPVLLKGFDENGFVFYTNYNSQKSKEMKENPNVCMVFFWDPLSKVVKIQGKAHIQEDKEANDKYFHLRPRDAQIASASSNQSSVIIGGRAKVEENYEVNFLMKSQFQELKKKCENLEEVPRPDNWGGWIIKPHYYEFWQGQSNRLHDRVVYKKEDGKDEWKIERLSP